MILENFKRSTAWDAGTDLPMVKMHNNPWIYSAYAMKIIGQDNDVTARLMRYANMCEVEPGLYNRWQDGSGGVFSWDEILGICFHSFNYDHEIADEIAWYLEKHDGVYFNIGTDAAMNFKRLERYNVYRIICVKPFVKACAGHRVGLFSQLQWSLFLIYDLISHKNKDLDPGGRLRIWIMLEAMQKYPLTGLIIAIWCKVMKNKGIGPKKCFNHYLSEVPVFKENAPENF